MIEIEVKGAEVKADSRAIVEDEARLMSQELSDEYARQLRLSLIGHRKVATASTLRSVEAIAAQSTRGVFHRQVVASRTVEFIVKGRPAGAKMPVTKVGDRFEPLPEVQQWFGVFNIPRALWFVILRAIKRRGIKPVDVVTESVRRAQPRMISIVSYRARRIVERLFA